jgi:hypothetical protein
MNDGLPEEFEMRKLLNVAIEGDPLDNDCVCLYNKLHDDFKSGSVWMALHLGRAKDLVVTRTLLGDPIGSALKYLNFVKQVDTAYKRLKDTL